MYFVQKCNFELEQKNGDLETEIISKLLVRAMCKYPGEVFATQL